MKKSGIRDWGLGVIIIIISMLNIYAQDYEPTQQKFRLGGQQGTLQYLSGDSAYFKQNKFFLSWEWMGGGKISSSLDVLGYDGTIETYAKEMLDSSDLLAKNEVYVHFPGWGMMNVRGIQYEPTLELDPNQPEKFVSRPNDTTHPIFGFATRRGRIGTGINFNRLIIDSTSLAGDTILDKPWPDDQLIFTNFGDSAILCDYQCQTMYFSINLRRFDNAMNNNQVLKIQLPYILKDTTQGFIQFSEIPDPNAPDTLPNGRGLIRKLQPWGPGLREIDITRNMIPPASQNKDITISAGFICDNNYRGFNNPHLNYSDSLDTNPINKLGIRITYLDSTCPLAIDWVRFEAPHTQKLLRGEYDSMMIANTQRDLDRFTNPTDTFAQRGMRLFRYKLGTDYGLLENMIGIRYFNKLIGNISTLVEAFKYPLHYNEYVNPPDRSLSAYHLLSYLSEPYSRKVITDSIWKYDPKFLGLINGYCGRDNNNNIETDSTKTHYETYLADHYTPYPITFFLEHPDSIIRYEQIMNTENNFGRNSYLAHWENCLYNNFLKDEQSGLLYINKAWWFESYILVNWFFNKINPDTNYYASGLRAFTGEELRLATYSPVILGGKGLIFDGPCSNSRELLQTRMYDENCIDSIYGHHSRDSIENLSDQQFLECDLSGTDFIRETKEIRHLNDSLQPLDTIARWLDRPRNKIYFGRKSERLEMKKVHDWIRVVQDTLMNLRLQCWYAKGFREWYTQSPDWNDNLLSKFLNTSEIRTKYPFFEAYEGTAEWNYRDSSFYDITILKDSIDNPYPEYDPLDMEYYLGVVNRRTNPLVQPLDNIYEGVTDSALLFYSTAEYDYNVRHNNGCIIPFIDSTSSRRDSTYWQNLWWRRMGSRLLSIPMKYRYNNNQDPSNFVLRVRELGAGTSIDNKWYRQPLYYHKIDTVIRNDDTLKIKLLPGEGKILKVTVSSLFVPVDSSQTPPCYNCDTLNNQNNFQVTFVQQPQNCNNCCWDIMLHNGTGCPYTNLPVMLNLYGGFFGSTQFTPGDFSYFDSTYVLDKIYFSMGNLDSFSTKKLGTICVPHNSNYSCELTIGKKIDGQWFKCGRTIDYDLSCIKTASCDSIRILFKPFNICVRCPKPPDSCCYQVYFLSNDSGYSCIHSMRLYKINGNDTIMVYENMQANNFNFQDTTNNAIDTLCVPSPGTLHVLAKFYDLNGNIICQHDASVYCNNIGHQIILPRESGYTLPDSTVNKSTKSVKNPLNNIKSLSVMPNPTDNSSTIIYELNDEDNIALDVYDILGNNVINLSNGIKSEGIYNIELNTTNYPAGIYLIVLKADYCYKFVKLYIIK